MQNNTIDKNSFLILKEKLELIKENNSTIHVNISIKRKNLLNVASKIEGIYDRFMCVSSLVNSYREEFTISYIDILTNKIKIQELE
ncbi:MAG: hypothetical protein E7176_05915 [Erysipelotrichaceae bacterium]|nr:hypothetical protein [Erysipelotrichaceae bacterium]